MGRRPSTHRHIGLTCERLQGSTNAYPLQRALVAPSVMWSCKTQFADPPGLRKGLPARSSLPKPNLPTFKPATNTISYMHFARDIDLTCCWHQSWTLPLSTHKYGAASDKTGHQHSSSEAERLLCTQRSSFPTRGEPPPYFLSALVWLPREGDTSSSELRVVPTQMPPGLESKGWWRILTHLC